jgi:sugar-specific transcriptional regulator TrmB
MEKATKKVLQSLGLSKEESSVYLAGLELGETTVQILSRKAEVKRPTTYKILEKLTDNGLFYQTFKGKKRFFNAESPEKLKSSLKQKEVDLEKILPELKSIYNIPGIKPKIKFYEGLAGAISVYEDTLISTKEGDTILNYTSINNLFEIFPKDYAKEYFEKRVKKNITVKVITPDCKESKEWQKNAEKELREIILTPENNQNLFTGDTEIYGDKVALISYKENFMAIVIESKEIANMQRFIFNLAWDKLKNIQ